VKVSKNVKKAKITAPYLFKYLNKGRICKRLQSPGINSMESIPTAYVALRAGIYTVTLFILPARRIDSLESISGLLKRLQIRAQAENTWEEAVKKNEGG
jgi:hypothetical protein